MSESQPTLETLREALTGVIEPGSRRDVVALGFVRNVAFENGIATVSYQLPNGTPESFQTYLRQTTCDVLLKTPGVEAVNAEIAIAPPQPPPTAAPPMPGIKHVVAVGAGKGGVGKSTIALLAAVGLTRLGRKVGLLDADVYGPSIPKLSGTESMQPVPDDEGRIVPPERHGIKIMSMGYLVAPDQAIIWRGPMAQKYLKEFLDRAAWGELDYLIVDLPPGTGDIPLTLAQSVPLSGAVIVCTPQDVALLDAVKALHMYEKLGVEPLGIIENMSYYICPHCGNRDEIFSHGGAEKAAADLNVPFLGAIPLNIAIRKNGDAGEPMANFTAIEPHLIASLEQFVARLDQRVTERAREKTPLPTLKISG